MAYAAQIALAKSLIARFGETSTYRRRVDGTPADPDKPWEPAAPTYTNTSVSAVWLDEEIARATGEVVGEAAQVVYVPASDLDGIAPDTARDLLVRADGSVWTIVSVEPLNPNGEKILYLFRVRE
jgi:hypothetical protein